MLTVLFLGVLLVQTVESALIISVLLSFTSQLTTSTPSFPLSPTPTSSPLPPTSPRSSAESDQSERDETARLLAVPGESSTRRSSTTLVPVSHARACLCQRANGELNGEKDEEGGVSSPEAHRAEC